MKVQIKIDQQAIADFFLHHVEKMVLGLIVACFVAMVYLAALRPIYSHPPEELASLVAQTHEHIEKTPADVGKKPVVDYPKRAELGQRLINVEGYASRNLWNPPEFPRPRKRADPALLAVQKLSGTADRGPFSLKSDAKADAKAEGAGGGSPPRGQRWIVVTGVVPLAQQIEAYNEAFKDMRRPETDTPQYLGYTIERAEVVDNASDADPHWTPIKMTAAMEVVNTWASSASEVVPAQFVIHEKPQRLAFPLGPLVGRTWDERVAHPPEIPLASATSETRTPAAGTESSRGETPQFLPETPTTPEHAPPATDKVEAPAVVPKCLLFRYFDFTVQSEKTYRYRFQLALANPNHDYEVRYLLNAASAAKTYNLTGWSEPTGPIAVPRDDQLLARVVKPPSRSFGEPEATVMIVKWLTDTGSYAEKEFPKMFRGQLLNSSATAPLAAGQAADQVNYQTDSLLLDMRGGDRFPGHDKGTAPGEILVWNYDHTLVIRSEAEDQAEVDRVKALAPPPPTTGGTATPGGDDLFGPHPAAAPPKPAPKPHPHAHGTHH